MSKLMRGKFGFTLFHLFFFLVFIAIAVVGIILIEYLFLGLGGAIIAVGILTFFVGHEFITGIYDKNGVEYYATNIRYKLILLLTFVVVGAAVAVLPSYFGSPHYLIAIILALLGVIVGVRLSHENHDWHYNSNYLSSFTALLGKIVPMAYIFGAGIYGLLFSIVPWVASGCIIACALLHLVRVICVYSDRPF